MTNEEKQLLLKDLCARLPYGVNVEITSDDGIMEVSYDMRLNAGLFADLLHSEDDFKPYLRPMSSITGKEETAWHELTFGQRWITFDNVERCADWLNSHHFDYRGLIDKGLALEANEGMYKTE